ncbi:MBL fold metallo-hydrolase [Peptococcaceae bacterium 1198_IL3148]
MINFTPYASSSKANMYTVDDGKTKLLIEMGLPIKEIKRELGFGLSEISFALLTHSHNDHCKAAKDIIKAGIDVYTSQGTIDALGLSGHRVHAVESKKQFKVGSWTVLPLESQHDAPEPLCFLLANSAGEKLLFATDTYYLRYKFVGLNVIAIECNYSLDILRANVDSGTVPLTLKNRLLNSHFSLDNVKEFLKANDLSKVQEIWLLHLSDGNSDAERFKREIQELTGKVVFVAGE